MTEKPKTLPICDFSIPGREEGASEGGVGREPHGEGSPNPEFRIRRLARRDLPRLLDIERLCYADPWDEEMFQTELSPGSYRFAVGGAFLRQDGTEGDLVGYVISHVLPEEVQILNVAVHPDHRRRGIARRLLSAVLNTAGEEGILRAVLEVRESNAVAQSLYRSFGFKIVGRRKGYYSAGHEDALTMVLQGTMPLFPKDYVLELEETS